MPRVFWNSAEIAVVGDGADAGHLVDGRLRLRDLPLAGPRAHLRLPAAAADDPLRGDHGAAVRDDRARSTWSTRFAAVILPTVASIFIIFYFRQATKAFPSELRDAARVDGLKEWQIFLFIYVPVMRSTYAAATIIVFMLNWNNYLWPLIVLQTNDKKTVTLVVSALLSAYVPDYGATLFATVLATLPTLVIFFVLQRQFVEGLTGGVK